MSDLIGRTVWIVKADVYDSQWIAGVYPSAEEAMAAHPGGVWEYDDRDGVWSNGLDWGEYREALAFVIGTTQPEEAP